MKWTGASAAGGARAPVGAYLAYADSNGLAGGVAGREHFGRPLQRAFDVDADGQLDTFDWYGLQGCYARTGGRCAVGSDYGTPLALDVRCDVNVKGAPAGF